MSWSLMHSAPYDGTPVLGVDVIGDYMACFWSEDEEQWLTYDDYSNPFGPILWQPLEEAPDEGSELWERAVDEFEERCREEEKLWGEQAPKRYPVPVELDDED